MEEQIDVLMATYNGAKYVKEQIESILNQSYKNLTLIISDDCSSDDTRKILKDYEKNNRVKIYYQEKNLGYVKNFEFLLTKVESDFFALSDQDDFWLPEKVEKSYKKIIEENSILVFGDLEVVDKNLNTINKSFSKMMNLDRKIEKYIENYRLNYLYNCVTGCTILARKELITYSLPFPTYSKYLIHDHWLSLLASLKGKISYINEPLIKYRQHGNNEVGVDKISHGFKTLKQVRKLFLDVKLGVFGTYVKYDECFDDKIKIINNRSYNYYKMLEEKKYINFKCWNIFHNLYKTESFMYYIENFLILNMPIIAIPLFKIRLFILKLLGKR